MKEKLILILKGIIIGFGKIIPGVSGSLIAVSLGLYEQCIECISNIFRNFRYNICFLGPIGLGIILSIVFGSNIIIYLMNHFYIPLMFLFVGLIAGGIPSILEQKKINSKFDVLLIVLSFSFIFIISLLSTNLNFIPNKNLDSLLIISLLGFIDATTMIIPGISGTAIFILIGCYNFILSLFGNLFKVSLINQNILYFTFFSIGLLIGVAIISKIMNYCFKKHKNEIYLIILGLSLSSVFIMFFEILKNVDNFIQTTIGLILMYFGYKIVKTKM